MTCTFFGHRDAPRNSEIKLEKILALLIEKDNVTTFYVGNNGSFDLMVIHVLEKLRSVYKHIDYTVVLAYLPDEPLSIANTLYPEGLENVPKRFCISNRNRWMIEKADVVVTCVNRTYGGAFQFKTLAKRKGKRVIELNE